RCRYFVGIDGVGKAERPLEAAIAALHEVIVLLLLLPLGLFLALQSEHAVAERDADVLLIHPRQLGFDDQVGVRLANIDAGHELLAPLTPTRRVESAKAPPEKCIEHAVHLLPHFRERIPVALWGCSGCHWFFDFLSHGRNPLSMSKVI